MHASRSLSRIDRSATEVLTYARVNSVNCDLLDRYDPDAFDEPIDPERLAACVADPDRILLVAVLDGVVVGQVLAAFHRHPDKAPECYVDDLGVADSAQRQGIGTRLIDKIAEIAKAQGVEELWLATEETNQVARSFYEAIGMEGRMAWVFERRLA